MARLLWICLGGAVGTGARYLLSGWTLKMLGPAFPYDTAVINITGSFLIAVLMQVGVSTDLMSPTIRLALTTGVLGGYTTFSTFSYETLKQLQDGTWALAALYVSVSVIGSLFGCFVGFASAKWAVAILR